MFTIVAAILVVLMSPLTEGTTSGDYQSPIGVKHPDQYADKAQLWISLGYGRTACAFGDEGRRYNLGSSRFPLGASDGNALLTSLVLNVGGQYSFYNFYGMNLNGGINFAIAQERVKVDALVVSETLFEPSLMQKSDFSPQNLTVFGEIASKAFSFRVAYLQDLGSEPVREARRSNSDLQNALQFGLSGNASRGSLHMFGSAQYVLRLPKDEDVHIDTSINLGDIIHVHAGAGYRWWDLETGMALLYRFNRKSSPAGDLGEEFRSGFLLTATPYITYAPRTGSFQVSLTGTVQPEYLDRGIALAGRNSLAPGAGITMSILYRM